MNWMLSRGPIILLALGAVLVCAQPVCAKEANADQVVYVTKTGAKYHLAGCRHLAKSAIPLSLKQAAERYTPCSVCSPPVMPEDAEANPRAAPSTTSPTTKPPNAVAETVYVTKSGSKYHRSRS